MSKTSKLDKFFTKPKVVKLLLNEIKKLNFINEKSVLIEPSAGDGKFLDGFKKNFPNNKFIAFDIEKIHNDVEECDFLLKDIEYNKNNIIIGNPPFGYKGKLAIEFINRASEIGDVICFVVPIQFRRWNLQKLINKELKLIYESENLERFSFLVNNKDYDVNCCFQIWIRDKENKYQNLRILEKPIAKSEDFDMWIYNNTEKTKKYFNKEKYKWDVAIRRQGFYDYNEFVYDENLLNPKRQYLFIKFNNNVAKEIFKQIDFNELANVNTVIKGFSNTDLVTKYNEIKKEMNENEN